MEFDHLCCYVYSLYNISVAYHMVLSKFNVEL